MDGELLSNALRDNGDEPIPPDVLDYLCQLLEGKVKKPRGRKPVPVPFARHRQMIMRYYYERAHRWLVNRKKRYGHLNGWPAIHDADFLARAAQRDGCPDDRSPLFLRCRVLAYRSERDVFTDLAAGVL